MPRLKTGAARSPPPPSPSWERPQNARHNGLLRTFVPKGVSIESFYPAYILSAADELNGRPRKKRGCRPRKNGLNGSSPLFTQPRNRLLAFYRSRRASIRAFGRSVFHWHREGMPLFQPGKTKQGPGKPVPDAPKEGTVSEILRRYLLWLRGKDLSLRPPRDCAPNLNGSPPGRKSEQAWMVVLPPFGTLTWRIS